MNNKGQSLITFVLIFPIIFLIVLALYDIGNIAILKNELNNINYLAIDYGLDIIDDENIQTKLTNLIKKNKNDIDNINIDIENNQINITLKSNITLKIINTNIHTIESSYKGYIDENNQKVIKKDK